MADETDHPQHLQFSFKWQGIAFDCAAHQGTGECTLEVVGHLCPLPYTAENPKLRARLLHICQAPPLEDAHGIREFRLTPDLKVQYFARHTIAESVLHRRMAIREAAIAVLRAKPWFQWLLEVMAGNVTAKPDINKRIFEGAS